MREHLDALLYDCGRLGIQNDKLIGVEHHANAQALGEFAKRRHLRRQLAQDLSSLLVFAMGKQVGRGAIHLDAARPAERQRAV